MSGPLDPRDTAALPPRPERPAQADCCGNDCPLCVFTLHDRELERWQEQVDAILAAQGLDGTV